MFLLICAFMLCSYKAFDDVERKEKPKEEVFEYKKRLSLDHEKSKQSLAEIYEQEYIKQIQVWLWTSWHLFSVTYNPQSLCFIILLFQNKTEEEENPAHVEIQKLMDTLFLKLDALSNFHFTPKPVSYFLISVTKRYKKGKINKISFWNQFHSIK